MTKDRRAVWVATERSDPLALKVFPLHHGTQVLGEPRPTHRACPLAVLLVSVTRGQCSPTGRSGDSWPGRIPVRRTHWQLLCWVLETPRSRLWGQRVGPRCRVPLAGHSGLGCESGAATREPAWGSSRGGLGGHSAAVPGRTVPDSGQLSSAHRPLLRAGPWDAPVPRAPDCDRARSPW